VQPPTAPPPSHPPGDGPTRGTRAWTLWSAEGAVDVELDAADADTVGDVLAALPGAIGVPASSLWSGSTPLPEHTALSAAALRHGAVLGLGRPAPCSDHGSPEASSGALAVQVVGGPDAGRTHPLGSGSVVLGRGAGCGLALTDPDVSRRHVVIDVASGRVTVSDLGSSNGTLLRTAAGTGQVGSEPCPWPVGATLLPGASALRLTGPRGAPLDCRPAPAGRWTVRPLHTPVPQFPEVTVAVPAPPADGPRRRLGWVAIAVPAVAGLLMAWLWQAPQFLFFALLSPVVAVGGWLSDRVSGRRDQRRARAGHTAALASFDRRLQAAIAAGVGAQEEAYPDPAHLAAAVRQRSSPLWSRDRSSPDLLVVRLGAGTGPTTVTRVEPDGHRSPGCADQLPVTVDLTATGGLGITGPRGPVSGVVRALICQLAALASPGELRIVLFTPAAGVAGWRWTRWFPHLAAVVHPGRPTDRLGMDTIEVGSGRSGSDPGTGAADDDLLSALSALTALGERGAPGRGPAAPVPATVLVLDTPVRPETAALLVRSGVICLALAESEAELALPLPACLSVTGETGARGRLRTGGPRADRELVLDAVPEAVAAGTARSLAALTPPVSTGGLPDTGRLLDVPGSGLRVDVVAGDVTGRWARDRRTLRCSLGWAGPGVLELDLCTQGPHLLVAGTTGSGKSELLQTLVASLALHHPPDRVGFLLVDYKGGAAFAEAAELPHTVGMLTDLDPQSTVRALRSLSAELTRRERLLADHGVRDLSDLPADVPAARLVIVVDEFATLAEELPGFVSGLVGTAQRGRSLGVHLVLATQRPSGVVSPEIRANCSLRICLRTTDESDSRDVLGSPLAAALPVGRPGRAYLRAGSAEPVLLQVARVAGPAAREPTGVRARRRPWPPAPPQPGRATPDDAPSRDLARLVELLQRRAQQEELTPPHRPWLPPLPDQLPAHRLDSWRRPGADAVLRIGLLDSPDTQSQRPLELDLAAGGGWLAVGGPRSGRTTLLSTVLGEAVGLRSPAQLQVYVLDHGGGTLAAAADALPHTGTTVGRDDAHRSVRLLTRLQGEVDRRRSGAPADGPALLLLIDGHESLAAQLDDAEPGSGSALLLRLVRDGAAAGLTCLLTAERAVPGSRLAAAMVTRLVLPLPDRADYAIAGVATRAVPGHRPPGRALVGEEAAECQLALPRPLPPLPGAPGAAVGAPAGGAAVGAPDSRADAAGGPIRVRPLPPDPLLPFLAPGTDAGRAGLWLPVGVGGDECGPVGVDLTRSGGLLVAGPPGSGRSTALTAFARRFQRAGLPVAELGRPCPASTMAGAVRTGPDAAPGDLPQVSDAPALQDWAARSAGSPAVVVADDIGTLPDPLLDVLGSLGRPHGELIVLAAGGAAELAGAFRGPVVALRRTRTALLLRPGPGDAELLGLRTPRTPLPARPGCGWLVEGGAATRVQVAWHRGEGTPA
jgi:S-DNA-T family DNA segregation ATPase FtsK/SpoIIIE